MLPITSAGIFFKNYKPTYLVRLKNLDIHIICSLIPKIIIIKKSNLSAGYFRNGILLHKLPETVATVFYLNFRHGSSRQHKKSGVWP